MKTVFLSLSLFLSLIIRSQSLSNTSWSVYNPNNATYNNYQFSATKMAYAGASATYTDVSLYFVNGNNFKIVDLPPQACPTDTGYYTFSNQGDFLNFTVVKDLCLPRQNVFSNFSWYKQGTVGMAAIAKDQGGISISPNPANDFITITAFSDATESRYVLSDLNGKIIQSGNLQTEKTKLVIQDLPSGVYILQTGDSKKFKIIKD